MPSIDFRGEVNNFRYGNGTGLQLSLASTAANTALRKLPASWKAPQLDNMARFSVWQSSVRIPSDDSVWLAGRRCSPSSPIVTSYRTKRVDWLDCPREPELASKVRPEHCVKVWSQSAAISWLSAAALP